jgi:hypothetical protein
LACQLPHEGPPSLQWLSLYQSHSPGALRGAIAFAYHPLQMVLVIHSMDNAGLSEKYAGKIFFKLEKYSRVID